ncbi:MAG TPA: hypothetical protein VD931_15400 [Baekduia sp.]|nr:hypothetical protein [Baekduia sp.]
MTRLSRLLLLLCVAVLVPLGLSACGSDDGGDDGSPAAVLQKTFGSGHAMKSGDLQLALDLDLEGLAGLTEPIKIRLDGPFASAGDRMLPKFDFDLELASGGQQFTAGAVSTGEKGYLALQGQAFDLGEELYKQLRTGYEQAQKQGGDDTKDGPTFASLGIKPLNWLRDPQAAGEEEVGGAETTHIRAGVDVKRFLEDASRLLDKAKGLQIQGAGEVPGGLSAKQIEQISRAVKNAQVDVWSGKEDRTLRRLRLAVDLDVPADVRKEVGGLQSGKVAFTFAVADLNGDQEIKAPENARPFEELQAALGGLLGGGAAGTGAGDGATGSGASGAGGGGTATAPATQAPATPDAPKPYLDCLQKAGQDISKIQGCAQYLEG